MTSWTTTGWTSSPWQTRIASDEPDAVKRRVSPSPSCTVTVAHQQTCVVEVWHLFTVRLSSRPPSMSATTPSSSHWQCSSSVASPSRWSLSVSTDRPGPTFTNQLPDLLDHAGSCWTRRLSSLVTSTCLATRTDLTVVLPTCSRSTASVSMSAALLTATTMSSTWYSRRTVRHGAASSFQK